MSKFLLTGKQEENLYQYLKKNVSWICPVLEVFQDKECSKFC